MTTVFPGALDSFTNPTATDTLASVSHADQHADINDAMEAVQAKLGTDSQRAELPLGVNLESSQQAGLTIGDAFVWRDIKGPINAPGFGLNAPTLTLYDDPIEEYAFGAGDVYGPIKLHIDHDYAMGTDMYIHTHWSHNGTNISGSLVIDYHLTYARGHSRGVFHTRKVIRHTISGINLTNTPAKSHRIDEVPMSTAGGSATLLDTSLFEPDGLILLHFDVVTIPTITGGSGKPFIHFVDGHYQSTSTGTKNKSPDFWE